MNMKPKFDVIDRNRLLAAARAGKFRDIETDAELITFLEECACIREDLRSSLAKVLVAHGEPVRPDRIVANTIGSISDAQMERLRVATAAR